MRAWAWSFRLVATTTVMAVQDRIREHAILQTIGLRPARIFRLVIAESTVVCLLGGITGTGLALLFLATGGLAIGAEGVAVAFRPSLQLGLAGIASVTGRRLLGRRHARLASRACPDRSVSETELHRPRAPLGRAEHVGSGSHP